MNNHLIELTNPLTNPLTKLTIVDANREVHLQDLISDYESRL